MNTERARDIAIQILDEFEELLAAKGIKVPSDDREGRKEEACLYGSEYYELEDAVTGILVEMVAGRVADFAVDPNNRAHYYIAVASGGVWKTTNAGTTWTPVFDEQGSYSVGCVTMDPRNPHVVWVGTGENNSQRSVGFGDGVYRTRDGGVTWENLGLAESEHIGTILIDPRDSGTVYVAAQRSTGEAAGEPYSREAPGACVAVSQQSGPAGGGNQ